MILVTTISKNSEIQSTRGRVLRIFREYMKMVMSSDTRYAIVDRIFVGDLGVFRQDVAKSRHRPQQCSCVRVRLAKLKANFKKDIFLISCFFLMLFILDQPVQIIRNKLTGMTMQALMMMVLMKFLWHSNTFTLRQSPKHRNFLFLGEKMTTTLHWILMPRTNTQH